MTAIGTKRRIFAAHRFGRCQSEADMPRASRACRSDENGPDSRRQAYSITSSASASSFAGMSRPSTFAVLRLMTSSNFVGCSTGRSAGFAPCRILSTNPTSKWLPSKNAQDRSEVSGLLLCQAYLARSPEGKHWLQKLKTIISIS
jgi:hypothetical protein